MTRRTLTKRVQDVQQVVDPLPPPLFLAYARAVIEFDGGDPACESSMRLARWLAGGRRNERSYAPS